MATRRSIQSRSFKRIRLFDGREMAATASAAGRRAVDEQAALGHDLLAGFQIAVDLDQIAVDETGLDLAQLDRLVFMRDPEPDLIALVDQRLLRHADRWMLAGGIERDVGEHFRL